MNKVVNSIKADLRKQADAKRAEGSSRYFKSEPGFVDVFIGVSVPKQRIIARNYYKKISPTEVSILLHSNIHEERLTALLLWVLQFKHGNQQQQQLVYDLYLKNTRWINNWDLVDTSARDIVGAYIYNSDRSTLHSLSISRDVWERRIAMIATSFFIANGEYTRTLKLAEQYFNDPHHYIQKATGWMLREIGKRDEKVLKDFLDAHAAQMPRTMLRYAIEKFDKPTRKAYLAIKRSTVQ